MFATSIAPPQPPRDSGRHAIGERVVGDVRTARTRGGRTEHDHPHEHQPRELLHPRQAGVGEIAAADLERGQRNNQRDDGAERAVDRCERNAGRAAPARCVTHEAARRSIQAAPSPPSRPAYQSSTGLVAALRGAGSIVVSVSPFSLVRTSSALPSSTREPMSRS